MLTNSPLGAEELIVLSPHWEGLRKEISSAFNSARASRGLPPVTFRFLDVGGTSNIVRFVRSSFQATPQGIGVDLFWGGSVDAHQEMARLHYSLALNPSQVTEGQVPANFFGLPLYDPDGHWFGTMLNGFGIFCNTDVLKRLKLPIPQSWEALTDPRYKTWVGAANPVNSGSAHMAYEIILQGLGWERGWRILEGVGQNVRVFSQYGSEVPQDIANGELACGIATDSAAWQQIRIIGSSRGVFIMPTDAYLMSPDPVSVLKGGPQAALAQEFVSFVLSREGQRLLMYEVGSVQGPKQFELARYPIRRDVYQEDFPQRLFKANPYNLSLPFSFVQETSAGRWQLVNDLFLVTLIERAHVRHRTGLPKALALVPSDSIRDVAARIQSPELRNAILNAWRAQLDSESSSSKRKSPIGPSIAALCILLGMCLRLTWRLRRSSRNLGNSHPIRPKIDSSVH